MPAVRVTDLDRDMSAVFPVGMDPDSEYLYDRMRDVTYAALRLKPGARVLDSAGASVSTARISQSEACTRRT